MMLLLGILLLEFNLQYKYIYYSLSQIDKKESKHYRLYNIHLHEQYEGCFSYYQEGFISGARLLLLLAMVAIRCVPDSCFLCKTQKRCIKSKVKVQTLDTLPSETQATSDKLLLVSLLTNPCTIQPGATMEKLSTQCLEQLGFIPWYKYERIPYAITVLTINIKC